MTMSISHKEQILRRIEPRIRRELQALLHDPDPTIIFYVAMSMYLSTIEKKSRVSSRCTDTEDNLLAPLQPFLHEWTPTFWHELRCFAESPYTMEAYDEVVEYRKPDSLLKGIGEHVNKIVTMTTIFPVWDSEAGV